MRALLALTAIGTVSGITAAAAQDRKLSDITLSETLTPADVRARWGPIDPMDINGSSWIPYDLANGDRLMLAFSPIAPHGLIYADLISGGRKQRIFSHNPRAASRSINQVDPCRVSEARLRKLWGKPDYVGRAGLISYVMANGVEVSLVPRIVPNRLSVIYPDGRHEQARCRSRYS